MTEWCGDCYSLFSVILTSLDGSIIASCSHNPQHSVCRQWLHLTPFSSCCRKLEVGLRVGTRWWGVIQDVGSGCNGSVSRRENLAVKWALVTNQRRLLVETNQSESIEWRLVLLCQDAGVILSYAQVIKCITRHTPLVSLVNHLHRPTNTINYREPSHH